MSLVSDCIRFYPQRPYWRSRRVPYPNYPKLPLDSLQYGAFAPRCYSDLTHKWLQRGHLQTAILASKADKQKRMMKQIK